MTETIAYIKESLRDLYPSSEVSSLVRLIMDGFVIFSRIIFYFVKTKNCQKAKKAEFMT